MLIYRYADILGYRDILRKHSVSEIYNTLDAAFSNMNNVINDYVCNQDIKNKYRGTLLYRNKDDIHNYKYAISKLKFKTYSAFDSIVVYWEDYEYSITHTELFILAIDAIYLCLYEKGITVRGAIGVTDEYKIDDSAFIIKNIDWAYELEKAQDWGNIIVFGKELLKQFYGFRPASEDYYARVSYKYEKYFGNEIIPFKREFYKKLKEQINDYYRELADNLIINDCMIVICPINNYCLSYFKPSFFQSIYDNTQSIINKGLDFDNHKSEMIYWTALFLRSRIEFCKSSYSLIDKLDIGNSLASPLWNEVNTKKYTEEERKQLIDRHKKYLAQKMKILNKKYQ